MTLETRADFARRLGVNRSTITRAAAAGRLVMQGGMVEVEASLARWHETKGGRTDVEARHAAQRGAEVSLPQAVGDRATGAQQDATEGNADSESRVRWKSLGMEYENKTIMLEMSLRRGLRYQLPAARREAAGLGATVRAALERLIDQTAPRLAVVADQGQRQQILAAELARIRRTVKVELPRALRRLRESGKVSA